MERVSHRGDVLVTAYVIWSRWSARRRRRPDELPGRHADAVVLPGVLLVGARPAREDSPPRDRQVVGAVARGVRS